MYRMCVPHRHAHVRYKSVNLWVDSSIADNFNCVPQINYHLGKFVICMVSYQFNENIINALCFVHNSIYLFFLNIV